MSTPFTTEELVEALKSMKVGKVPGPDASTIFTQKFLYMQDMLQRSDCVSLCLGPTCLERCKAPKSGARQLSSSTRSLTSPMTTIRATGPSHRCASYSSCLKGWSMDVSTPSLIPSYLMNRLASTKDESTVDQVILLTQDFEHCCFEAKETAGAVQVDLWHCMAPRVALKAPPGAAR